ncbi:MAG TPA: hypothetical protein VFJ55_01545 [Chthoniobacterales bacterium]|nr:hypothetical protein [Chthoniobacterales bacterium]
MRLERMWSGAAVEGFCVSFGFGDELTQPADPGIGICAILARFRQAENYGPGRNILVNSVLA